MMTGSPLAQCHGAPSTVPWMRPIRGDTASAAGPCDRADSLGVVLLATCQQNERRYPSYVTASVEKDPTLAHGIDEIGSSLFDAVQGMILGCARP